MDWQGITESMGALTDATMNLHQRVSSGTVDPITARLRLAAELDQFTLNLRIGATIAFADYNPEAAVRRMLE